MNVLLPLQQLLLHLGVVLRRRRGPDHEQDPGQRVPVDPVVGPRVPDQVADLKVPDRRVDKDQDPVVGGALQEPAQVLKVLQFSVKLQAAINSAGNALVIIIVVTIVIVPRCDKETEVD